MPAARLFIMYASLVGAALKRPGVAAQVGTVKNKPVVTDFILLLDAPRPSVHDMRAMRATLEELRSVIATGKVDPS